MSAEVQLTVDMWEAVRDLLPANKRAEAAFGIMRALSDYGLEASDLRGVGDEDDDLAEAFQETFLTNDDEPEDEE